MSIISPKVAAVTAATTTGFLTVADSLGFVVGAIVWVSKAGVESK